MNLNNAHQPAQGTTGMNSNMIRAFMFASLACSIVGSGVGLVHREEEEDEENEPSPATDKPVA